MARRCPITDISQPSLPDNIKSSQKNVSSIRTFLKVYSNCNIIRNNEDSDQTPQNVASDLSLYCLPIPHKKKES